MLNRISSETISSPALPSATPATSATPSPHGASQCRLCGMSLANDYGDGLCLACFVARGMETVVEMLSNQEQESLFESLFFLSHQAHQREQTDTAFYALSAAYHAAYQASHLEAIMREAQTRANEWSHILDECGEVRASDYWQLANEAQALRDNMAAAIHEQTTRS